MRTKVYLAIALVVLIPVSVILWHGRLSQDFWPIDSGRVSPNLLANVIQWAAILIAASLLYPPFRKAVDKWISGHMESARDELHKKLEHNADLLRHIIKHHPDIPNHDHTGKPLVDD